MLNTEQMTQLMMLNTLGLSILVETFKMAAYFMINTNGNGHRTYKDMHCLTEIKSESRACFAFIQGTGLEQLINNYYLNLNAEELRKTFYNQFDLKNYL